MSFNKLLYLVKIFVEYLYKQIAILSTYGATFKRPQFAQPVLSPH